MVGVHKFGDGSVKASLVADMVSAAKVIGRTVVDALLEQEKEDFESPRAVRGFSQ